MLRLILCSLITLSFMQSDTLAFYIEKIFTDTKYDSRYILGHALLFLPPDKRSNESDVQCLVSELKASGIFEDVQAKLIQTGKDDARDLEIKPIYHRDIERFVISEIALSGFPEIDRLKFQSLLKKKGIKPGIPFLRFPFNELEDKVGEAGRESYTQIPVTAKNGVPYWITIKSNGLRKVKLIVSPPPSRCGL